ncbi:hypothetical protein TNCV_3777651 [Trichonephila clavipes]|nr:hypothetical protein TNCV_3777651 [Trichonephila clavipes]
MRHDLFAGGTVGSRSKDGSAPQLLRYSEQFLSGHTIISFWSGQTLTKIGDDTLLTIYFLGQHSSDAFMTCIRIQNKLSVNFRISQDWGQWVDGSAELSCFVPTDELSCFVPADELNCFVPADELFRSCCRVELFSPVELFRYF